MSLRAFDEENPAAFIFPKFDMIIRSTCNFKRKAESKGQRGELFRQALNEAGYTVSDEAFVRMALIRSMTNMLPMEPARDAKLYRRLKEVVKNERQQTGECYDSHERLLQYLGVAASMIIEDEAVEDGNDLGTEPEVFVLEY